ncbi:MAG TPA: phytanoyl-CoA dioxygenase family protein [Ignavibacteria bacterium]|nr:phytanoyl-CoA dioxygenase family protein [Ignavibacteria bacterium]
MATKSLSIQQIQHFRNSGYLKLEKRIPNVLVNNLINEINKNLRLRLSPLHEHDNGVIYRLDNVYERGEIFKKLVKHPFIINSLTSLLGPNIEFALNRHNHATVNRITNRRFHRDILQWTRSVITVLVYLEKSTLENGCTEIIPSSQYLPYSGKPNNGGTWLDEDSRYADLINQAIPIPMEKGGILFLDSLTFHSVGKNISNNSRMSIALGYHSVDELIGDNHKKTKILVKGKRIYRGNIKFEE